MHQLSLFEDSTARLGQIQLSVASYEGHCEFIEGLEAATPDQITEGWLQLTEHWQDLQCEDFWPWLVVH